MRKLVFAEYVCLAISVRFGWPALSDRRLDTQLAVSPGGVPAYQQLTSQS